MLLVCTDINIQNGAAKIIIYMNDIRWMWVGGVGDDTWPGDVYNVQISLFPRLLTSFLSHTVCDKKLGRSLGTRLVQIRTRCSRQASTEGHCALWASNVPFALCRPQHVDHF